MTISWFDDMATCCLPKGEDITGNTKILWKKLFLNISVHKYKCYTERYFYFLDK